MPQSQHKVVVMINGVSHPASQRTAQVIVWLIEHAEHVQQIQSGQITLNLGPKALTNVVTQCKFEVAPA